MPRKGEIGNIGKTAPGDVVTLLELLLDEIGNSGTVAIEERESE